MSAAKLLYGLTIPLVALSLVLVGCSDDEADSAPTDTPATVARPTDTPAGVGIPLARPPSTTATAGATTVEMGIGTYCWTQMCIDMVGPVTKATLAVRQGETVVIAVPSGAPPLREVSVAALPAVGGQDIENGARVWPMRGDSRQLSAARDALKLEVGIDLEPGQYVLVVGMFFERGDVSYGLVLEVR